MNYTDKILEEFDIKQRLFLGGRLHSTAFNKWFVEMLTSKIAQTLAEERERVRGVIRNQEGASLPDLYSMSDDIISKSDLLSSLDKLTDK